MRRVVVDTSVAIKWLVPHRPEEGDVDQALALFGQIDRQDVFMVQPPHFIAELMGVVARLEPGYADRLFVAVSNLEMIVVDHSEMYRTAIRLSIELNHHLFDTLYHAVALNTPGATHVTADRRYYDKALGLGRIAWLSDLKLTL